MSAELAVLVVLLIIGVGPCVLAVVRYAKDLLGTLVLIRLALDSRATTELRRLELERRTFGGVPGNDHHDPGARP